MFVYLILDIWFICIKLLEDEDVYIRKEFVLDVQKRFFQFRIRFYVGIVFFQVEKVIELSFEYFILIFGNWERYFDYFLRWVFDVVSYVVFKGDFVRRVFDKEIDNYYEEKLFVC